MWNIYPKYPDLWETMLQDVKEAKYSIKFEQYIFADLEESSIGKQFIERFKEKAKEGLEVKVLLDGFGSHTLAFSEELGRMKKAGVEVMFHTASSHKLRNWAIFKSFFRDHKKLLLIDQKIAHMGGGIIQEKARGWGELNVRFQDEEVIKNLYKNFDTAWKNLKESNAFVITKPLADTDGFTVLSGSPRHREHYILWDILKNIKEAKKYIRIVSPYFVPTGKLLKEIFKAQKRGVEVEIILPKSIDNLFAKFTSYDHYKKLLKKGVNLKLYKGYNHAKAVVVDGKWCTFGSTNMDRLSLVHNYEINVSSTNKEFIKDIEKCFELYLATTFKLTLKEWEKRPLISKVLEKLSVILRPWA